MDAVTKVIKSLSNLVKTVRFLFDAGNGAQCTVGLRPSKALSLNLLLVKVLYMAVG